VIKAGEPDIRNGYTFMPQKMRWSEKTSWVLWIGEEYPKSSTFFDLNLWNNNVLQGTGALP